MILLSLIAIIVLKKYVNFRTSAPKLRNVLKPILLGIAITIAINLSLGFVSYLVGVKPEAQL